MIPGSTYLGDTARSLVLSSSCVYVKLCYVCVRVSVDRGCGVSGYSLPAAGRDNPVENTHLAT